MFFVYDIVRVEAFVDLFSRYNFTGRVDILLAILKLARWLPTWEMTVHMAASDDVFGGG